MPEGSVDVRFPKQVDVCDKQELRFGLGHGHISPVPVCHEVRVEFDWAQNDDLIFSFP